MKKSLMNLMSFKTSKNRKIQIRLINFIRHNKIKRKKIKSNNKYKHSRFNRDKSNKNKGRSIIL